jgi:hypothetical protein
MKTYSHPLRTHDFGDAWKDRVENRWNYADFLADERWRKDWISFDGVVAHPTNDLVYCGITSFDADIFWAWNRSTRSVRMRSEGAKYRSESCDDSRGRGSHCGWRCRRANSIRRTFARLVIGQQGVAREDLNAMRTQCP